MLLCGEFTGAAGGVTRAWARPVRTRTAQHRQVPRPLAPCLRRGRPASRPVAGDRCRASRHTATSTARPVPWEPL